MAKSLASKPPTRASRKTPQTQGKRASAERRERRDTSISLRVSESLLGLITTAAIAAGKSRTEFVLESARRQATEILLDQRLFELSPEQHDAFVESLAVPPPANAALKALMSRRSPWEA